MQPRPLVYEVCREMIACGVFPSPKALNEELGRIPERTNMNNLNGRECAARTKALLEAGYIKGDNGRWIKK